MVVVADFFSQESQAIMYALSGRWWYRFDLGSKKAVSVEVMLRTKVASCFHSAQYQPLCKPHYTNVAVFVRDYFNSRKKREKNILDMFALGFLVAP